MQKIISIAKPYKKKTIFSYLKSFIYKTSETLEILIILILWLYIFKNQNNLLEFTREEIITYLIFGNIIGIITGLLLKRILKHELISKNSELIIKNPIKYACNNIRVPLSFTKNGGIFFSLKKCMFILYSFFITKKFPIFISDILK